DQGGEKVGADDRLTPLGVEGRRRFRRDHLLERLARSSARPRDCGSKPAYRDVPPDRRARPGSWCRATRHGNALRRRGTLRWLSTRGETRDAAPNRRRGTQYPLYCFFMTQVSPGRGPLRVRALGLLLVVALVLAQTGALLHEYSHLRASGDATLPGQTCAD